MNFKKLRIISTITIFLLCFPLHFLYEWIPSSITAIFVPVNESIWEHMKLIFTGSMLYYFIEYIILYKKKELPNNYCLATFTSPLIAIIIYLTTFLPLYYNGIENLIVTLVLLFIVIAIASFIHYKIIRLNEIPYQKIIAILGIIITFTIFGILTYNPPKTDLFFDTKEEKYGINIYNI